MLDPSTEAIELPDRPPRWRDMLSALGVRNYRFYTVGQLFSLTAVWMQRITQDWLLFELTGNVTAVGLLVMIQFGPILLFGLYGGLIVDRYEKRKLIMIAQIVVIVVGAILAVLAFTDTISAWHIFALALVVGIVSVIDQPARQVFVSELVGRSLLRNAVSTNSAIFQLSALIGPAVAGILLVTFGPGPAFAATAVGAAVGLTMLLSIRTSELTIFPPAPREKGQLAEAVKYVRKKPVIFWTLTMLLFVSGIGMNWSVLLAPMADRIFQSGAQGYGSYNSAIAVGALIGALLSMRRQVVRLRTLFVGVMFMMSLKLTAGLMPYEWAFMVTIALTGLSSVLMWTAANALVQTSSNMLIRGRVMSIYLLIAIGGQALGGPFLGSLVDLWGARAGMVISGAVPLIAAIVISVIISRTHGIKLNALVRRPNPGE